jgi:hypothetical protein
MSSVKQNKNKIRKTPIVVSLTPRTFFSKESCRNKKGLSQIIATVIFIVLSISAIALLFPAVKNLTERAGAELSPIASCIQMQQSRSTIQGVTYIEKDGENYLTITVKRSPIHEIESFDFILETETESQRFRCGLHCGGACNIQGPNQEKTFYFDIENVQSVKLLVNENCEMDEKAVF